MKNKATLIIVFALTLGLSYSVQAQSTARQKMKNEIERGKRRSDELVMKLQEQQRQTQDEKRGAEVNFAQQKTSSTPASNQNNIQVNRQPGTDKLQSTKEQLILNNRNKKEDVNQ